MKPEKRRVLFTRFLQHYSTETLFRLVLLLLTLNGNTGMVLNDIGTILRDLVPIDNVPPITMNRVVSKLHHQIHSFNQILQLPTTHQLDTYSGRRFWYFR